MLSDLRKEKIIASFIRCKPNDVLDSSGIDFLIILNDGYAIPLQCKTYSHKNDERIADHMRKHRDIKFIMCVVTHTFERDKQKVYLLARKGLLAIINGKAS